MTYKKQVKFFQRKGNPKIVEDEINAFLETINYADVLEIRQGSGINTVMVVYRVAVSDK